MKSIISLLTVCAGAAMLSTASAETISSAEKLSNTATYTLSRRASSGNSGAIGSTASGTIQAGVTATSDAAVWSIHYSPTEKAYYLYNMSAGKFAGASGSKATVSDAPADMRLMWVDHASSWVIDCGGSLLGFSETGGQGVFVEDYTSTTQINNVGIFFTISTAERTLTQAESDAIEAKIKAGRPAVLAKYTEFVTNAKNVTKDGLTNYAGAYDVALLEKMLSNPDKYSMVEFEEAYRNALTSRLPQPGAYYVLRNSVRPTAQAGNMMAISYSTDAPKQASIATPQVTAASADYTDGLNLFCFEPVGTDCSTALIRNAATGRYLVTSGNSSAALWLDEKGAATAFSLEAQGEFSRPYRLAIPGNRGWVTIDPNGNVVSYGSAEAANYFYFERITTLSVTTTTYAMKALVLPCPVEIPADCEAVIAVEEHEGKVYLEKHEGIVPANVPFILRSPSPKQTVKLTIADENPAFRNDNVLTGQNVRYTAPAAYHVPALDGTRLYFRRLTPASGTVFPANTTVLISENTGELETTFDKRPYAHITEIAADEIDGEAVWYDLQGRRIASPAAGGLYINGTTRDLVRVK